MNDRHRKPHQCRDALGGCASLSPYVSLRYYVKLLCCHLRYIVLSDRAYIVVFGATGLFGELLVRRLVNEQRYCVVGVARNLSRLKSLQGETEISIAVVDRDDEASVAATLTRVKPFAVIDCAGPFQYYGADPYRFARQVLQAGAHYIDIADAPSFVSGISELDSLAREHSLLAIAGASSAPAISAAAADRLVESLRSVTSIEVAIVPGNRTRRTLSVMKAILGQVGQPFQLTRDGKLQTVYGWTELRKINQALPAYKPVRGRLASLVNTPENILFARRYNAKTVAVYAGLELKGFHRLLQFGGKLVRLGLLKSLLPLAKTARWIASFFERFGSDVGGMQVCVVGEDTHGQLLRRTWDLVTDDGSGPHIPTLPVSVLLEKLHRGAFKAGARPACGEVSLNDLQPHIESIGAETVISEQEIVSIFKTALGETFNSLPPSVRDLHNTVGRSVYRGMAQSMGPTGLSGRLAALMFGFPAASDNIPVEVTVRSDPNGELWIRNFSGSVFKSQLSLTEHGQITERFGPLVICLGLNVREGCLYFPVTSAKLFGLIPIPRLVLPKSIAHESVDSEGRFTFDVNILTPFGARIAHYKGWLSRSV